MSLGPMILDLAGLVMTAEEAELLRHPWVGGVILFSRNYEGPEQLKALTAQIRAVQRPEPLLISVDHEGGRVQRFREGFEALPSFRELASDIRPELTGADLVRALTTAQTKARAAGSLLARELRAHGVGFSYTPVLDLDHGRSTVIGERAFHRSPAIVAQLAAAVIQGLALEGFACCGKHFPGHGWAEADSHIAFPRDDRPLAQILAEDAWPYALLGSGPFGQVPLTAVMPSHVVYSQVDELPAGFSRIWIQEVLRGRLGFDGLVVSDDLGMAGASIIADATDRAQAALEAGCDAFLLCNQPELARQVLQALPARLPSFLDQPGRRSLRALLPQAVRTHH